MASLLDTSIVFSPKPEDMVATVGAAVPATIVDPHCAAICTLSEISLLLTVFLFSALSFVCSVTAESAVDLAVFFFVVSFVMSSAEQVIARGVLIDNKAVTPAGLLVKVSVMSSINLSREAQVVGTG